MDDHAARLAGSSTADGRYRLLIEAVTDYAIYMLDSNGLVTSWNPGAERIKGYQASEIIGRHFSLFNTDEDRQAGLPARALETVVREGKFESEGWRVRKDGARFWAHVVIDPIRDPSGTIIGYAKITRDLTERRVAAAALRQSEEQFRLLVQGVSDYAIYMLDPGGRVATWNPGAQRIKGYLAGEITGEHFSRFYTEEDREAGVPQQALEAAVREGRFEKEGWRVRKDGSRFWASVVIDAVRDESGAIVGFAKITRDISEKKETQRALDQAREALFQMQKMESLGQLTGGIAHDFNNLLMAILSSLQLLRKRLPDERKISALLDNAFQGAERGVSLTQRMLAFARRQDLKFEPIAVPALVHGMTDLLQRALGPSVAIEVRFPLGLSSVLGDVNQLESALINLTVNARDALGAGGTITIAGREESVTGNRNGLKAGRYVCLSVSDTGEGMDEATLARATEPFFTTKGVGKGTGLGLSMVRGLMEQMGGQLVLKSRKGEGTTAELWLPVAKQDQGFVRPDRQAITQGPKKEMRPLVVLAVDDDGLILMNLTAMLEDMGHSVLAANSGKEALDILRRDKTVDLVITDQAMPQMTGIQLVEAINAQWPNLKIILATGYAELPADADRGVPKLAKPFFDRDLAKAIADVIPMEEAMSRIH